ncbi:hypothetical protein L195_g030530 [Trifolium pratense]|uniref:Uncharacterized protein n=1 Tax=Trifolium pratense TaxID=57577 RepID=A0A2K3L7T9_TRIPR|nr:hypothetical protein L195_g030530 [Trifolium pratense]
MNLKKRNGITFKATFMVMGELAAMIERSTEQKVDRKPSKELKVGVKLNKQPKVDEKLSKVEKKLVK